MAMSCIAMTVLLPFAAAPEPVRLTPDSLAEYDYYFRCGVHEPVEGRADATDPVVVFLRFAPKRKGIHGISATDLNAIKAVSLIIRDGDALRLSVPLRTKVDPGNYVHLYARFSVQRDLLAKMQLTFEDHGEAGKRTFLANLKDFIEEK